MGEHIPGERGKPAGAEARWTHRRDSRVVWCVATLLVGFGAALSATPEVQLPPGAPSVFSRLDLGSGSPRPRIRVGIRADDNQVRVGATSARFQILEGGGGTPLWSDRAPGPVLVVPLGGRTVGPGKVFGIQVGAFRDEAAARARAAALEEQFRAPVEVVRDPARGVWRVRLGRAEQAAGLADLLSLVRAAGLNSAFIAGAPKPAAPRLGASLELLDARWLALVVGGDRIIVVPEGDGFVTVDGRPYRGVLELFLNSGGGVSVVNEVSVEDYLRGVVPEELGPGLFPEIEALKAQAIAARTYAAANRGQFAADGFDLCDTPRCQVYGGVASEHPASDRAVRETAGEILVFDARPINALFTSTCGGRTEDVGVVFPEWASESAYLRGVACRPDEDVLERRVIKIAGRPPAVADDARAPGPEPLALARLVAHGVVPRDAWDAGWRRMAAGRDEVQRWGAAVALLAGRPAPPPFVEGSDRLSCWRWLAAALGFAAEGAGLVAPGDEAFALAVEDRAEVPAADQPLVADLLARGFWTPGPDGRLQATGAPARSEVLEWLSRAADALDAVPAREGLIAHRATDGVVIRERGVNREWVWGAEPPALLVEAGGVWRPASAVEALPGDRVLYIGDEARGRLGLLGFRERKGSADDRGSPKFRWTIVRDREFIESHLAELSPVGKLLDIVVRRRGSSGRVAELELRGAAGSGVIDGFRFRTALDLPDTLFSLDVQRTAEGALRRVTFSGRGWGHGVGLCQYGAYGMALRGRRDTEILQHYYTGVQLAQWPGGE